MLATTFRSTSIVISESSTSTIQSSESFSDSITTASVIHSVENWLHTKIFNICRAWKNSEFVGRKDTQVKLRGQRIELEEVEHRLRQSLPARTEVVAEVITPAGKGGQAALVAFVTVGLDEMPQEGVGGCVLFHRIF